MIDLIITNEQLLEIQAGVMEITSNNSISTNDLHEMIGRAIFHDFAVELTPKGSGTILRNTTPKKRLSEGTNTISSIASIESGKSFWQRFREHTKEDICSDPMLRELFDEKPNLQGTVKSLLHIILPAIGVAVSSAFLTGIVIALIALLLREGYKTFCAVI